MTLDDRFIQEHAGLVKSIAYKLKAQLDLNCELDDLIAFGYTGLVEAKQRFDPSRGVQFNTFAYYRIRGAVLDGIRQMAYLPRRAYSQLKLAQATDLIAEPAGEVAAQTPEQKSDTKTALEHSYAILGRLSTAYIAEAMGQGEEVLAKDPERHLAHAQQVALVKKAVDVLPERERALVVGFYFENRNFDEVAKELNISKSWASRLHAKALDLLRQALEEVE
ncbi:MAG: sigma-70 family RNA polymerase sigma factor [Myxococcales bacterium]|nr:sigma-70 family RNA polymerase sigma factor [Myxococcales bacterium]